MTYRAGVGYVLTDIGALSSARLSVLAEAEQDHKDSDNDSCL